MDKALRNAGQVRRGNGPVTVEELAQEVYTDDEIGYNNNSTTKQQRKQHANDQARRIGLPRKGKRR